MPAATINFPAAAAKQLTPYGATVGRLARRPFKLAAVTLPDGWTTDGAYHDVPDRILDQHGRLRAGTSWILDENLSPKGVQGVIHGPEVHADAVAERGATLTLDTWARPHLMIGRAAEPVATFRDLILLADQQMELWAERQPRHADKLRSDRKRYEEKLSAWSGLFDILTQAVYTAPTR
jgi:hypothetical protein